MNKFKRNTLSAMILVGGITAGAPLMAGDNTANTQHDKTDGSQKISLTAGHNVVDAVDDLRETTADLVGAMLDAKEEFAAEAWRSNEVQLTRMEGELQQMEQVLDKKAEKTDSSWLNWMADRDYSVTVKEQIATLASNLETLSGMLAEASGNFGQQIIVGHNLVDQVDDVRETVGDLFRAIGDAGPEWGWFDDPERFSQQISSLQSMEKSLDMKAEMSDSEWQTFIGSADYPVEVRKQIKELAGMVDNLANSITTESRVSQTN